MTAIVAEVAGDMTADANRNEKTKTLKTIVRDHLEGAEGRAKVENWVPRWMAFPPSAYTARGGVGTVERALAVAAARSVRGPSSTAPTSVLVLPAPVETEVDVEREAA